ncbi:hypothetical protein BJX61DRAFT_39396 [Aspergillus egyptiacus]|nr:hypothetical protein BJX61DRAFT_39396 [Aspergillus egyptiacus]
MENEYGFPIPQARSSRSGSTILQELAYVIRRVEPNGRSSATIPWSIRQTGVYQQWTHPKAQSEDGGHSLILLVAPSADAEGDVLHGTSARASDGADVMTPAILAHELLIAESMCGWSDYMCWLEDQLMIKSTRIIVTPVDADRENRPITFNANDRQDLKELDDYVTDLLVILDTTVQTIRRVRRECQRYCSIHCTKSCACPCRRSLEGLQSCADEAHCYLTRARVLQSRVQSVQSLLFDLLAYEEIHALRDLARASNQESVNVKDLAIRSAQDAAAVKLLTVIGLVFLPTTIVENFFSTEFVKADGKELQVSKYVWVMVAVALPLTALVIVCWRLWLRFEFSKIRPAVSLARQPLGNRRLLNTRKFKTMDSEA